MYLMTKKPYNILSRGFPNRVSYQNLGVIPKIREETRRIGLNPFQIFLSGIDCRLG